MNAVSIIGVVLAFGLLFLSLLALCAEKGIHPLGWIRNGFRRLPGWKKALVLIFVSVWIAFAGTKDGTNGVDQVEGETNTVTQVEGGTNQMENGELRIDNAGGVFSILRSPFSILHSNAALPGNAITGDDVERMFRVATTFDGNLFAEPTANAVTNAAWLDYGGMSDAFRLLPEGWRFPFADKTTAGLTVFQNGEFRPNVKTHFFPPPFDAELSLLPRMNWGLLPAGGESVFWHEQTPSNSLVLTWHNALYNRDVNCPTNFQAELFADGRFDYRYPDRTVQYAPVFPFDWDGDGLENSVDLEPLVAGPDAHGTNAEWYDTVGSAVFTKVDPNTPDNFPVLLPNGESVYFKPSVNANAYYFVDVVAEHGPAAIHFVADGRSRLGNPVVVARAGETNRVPLLIGATYNVASTVPLGIVSPTNAVQIVSENGDGTSYSVSWPVSAVFQMALDNSFSLELEDGMHGRLNGTCNWGRACCLVTNGNSAKYSCDGCGCEGCHAHVTYEYEDYGITFVEGGGCGCGSEPSYVFEAGTNEVETASGGTLSCRFDRRVILFEEDYPNTPTCLVQGGSTTSCLAVVAHGGPFGGTLTMTSHNLDSLDSADGGAVYLRSNVDIPPGEVFTCVVPCVGRQASGAMNDVWVEAGFRENLSGERLVKFTCTTVVGIDITSENTAPDNASTHRHEFGIGEVMRVRQTPGSPMVSLSTTDATISVETNFFSVAWGVADTEHDFSVSSRGVTYVPKVSVVKPSGIRGTNHWSYVTESTNHISGAIYLRQQYVVLPTTVCFNGISVEEVPCYDVIEPTGYFAFVPTNETNRLSHTREAGAGKWYKVDKNNLVGREEEISDRAGVGAVLVHVTPDGVETNDVAAAWMAGRKEWKIPFGWQNQSVRDPSQEAPIGIFFETRQIFTINSNGDYKVEKLGHSAERKFDGRIFTDGKFDPVATRVTLGEQ